MLMLCQGKPPFKEIMIGADRVAHVRAATTLEKARARAEVLDGIEKHVLATLGEEGLAALAAVKDPDPEAVAVVELVSLAKLVVLCGAPWMDTADPVAVISEELSAAGRRRDPAVLEAHRRAIDDSVHRCVNGRPDYESFERRMPPGIEIVSLGRPEEAWLGVRPTNQAEFDELTAKASAQMSAALEGDAAAVNGFAELGDEFTALDLGNARALRAVTHHLALIEVATRCIESHVGLVDEHAAPILGALTRKQVAALLADCEITRAVAHATRAVININVVFHSGTTRPRLNG